MRSGRWLTLQGENAPLLAILDWMMPGMDGLEVRHKVRWLNRPTPSYLILLTAKGEKEDIVRGLDAETDDYLTKPFDREELRACLQVGARVVEWQRSLSERISELEKALS